MTPEDRAALATDVQQAEGCRLAAYQDTLGVWTIGYGTNLQELTIDGALALTWLRDKLSASETEAQRFPWFAGVSAVRQRAIVEMIYNLGLTRFLGFTRLLAAMASGQFAIAAQEALSSRWAAQVGPTRSGRIAQMLREG